MKNQKTFFAQCKNIFSEAELSEFKDIAIIHNIEPPSVIRIGNAVLKSDSDSIGENCFPLLIPLRDAKGLSITVHQNSKADAHLFLQLIALRLLSSFEPELIRCHFIDADNFGNSFQFISGIHKKIIRAENMITSEQEIDRLIKKYEDIAKMIVNKRLTHQFKTLSDFNKNSGTKEPYHFLFVADFPAGFNKDRIERLSKIIRNGRRVGMYVFLTYDPNISAQIFRNSEDVAENLIQSMPAIIDITQHSCSLKNIENIEDLWKSLDLKIDGIHNPITTEIIENLISKINRNCEEKTEQELKEDGIRIPIGTKGHEPHDFTLGYGEVYHALVGGETGWGKTMLLHNIIINCLKYSSEELNLYLLDYKEGTEFNVYQNHPNVKKNLMKNNIEEGIEVLKEMQNLITHRGELFNAMKVNRITQYNIESDRKIPRILIIIDEFQKLFAGNYKASVEVNKILEDIAKRGRSFGIHLLLSSQSLINTQLDKTTMNQLGLRIVFKIHRSECSRFLDYNNEEPAGFTKKGEAIYNSRSGLLNGNEIIQVNYIDEKTIPMLIEKASRKKSIA